MSKTFEQGKEEIAKLCKYFATNHEAFRAPGVKEAHVRQSLIDPMFEALGWDVRNAGMVAPQYREVIPEDSLDIEGHQKAPDYTFRVGPQAKFYAEAKKCGINIKGDPGPAYQLRRYGWSAKVALSVLTDFEEFGVYDCTLRPKPHDKASRGRIHYYAANEYPDRWREIWDRFSREAVWSGAYDQYAASKRKRGTSEVDVEFLKEIEGWRETLARNIALRNTKIGIDELNKAVQLTIDRIIFLRMAEDRGIEPYQQLMTLCGQPEIYKRFVGDLCRKADERYNSGLFHFQKEAGTNQVPDQITPRLEVDDKVFKPILESLYFVHGSPYHFGVLPVEILGTVYERFLGKVIRLTAHHQAKIEEKPEVRKAGGVYYTPSYIVDYIVKQTVGKQIEGKSPAQLAGTKSKPPFRVLDMACGSGSFLLGAYKFVLAYCLRWYMENNPETRKKAVYQDERTGEWRMRIEEKKRILISHIFGVDVDAQAVEVSKLSLLLKVLEGETEQTVGQQTALWQERALPNLANNIKCGNSLIGPDYFTGNLLPDPEEMKWVNAFGWEQGFPDAMQAGGFDCVIGNPPYIRMEGFAPIKDYLRTNYKAHEERADFYTYFIEKGLRLVRETGLVGMIVSNKFAVAKYGRPLREVIARTSDIVEIADYAGARVFRGATVRTMILVMRIGSKQNWKTRYVPVPRAEHFAQIEGGILGVDEYGRMTEKLLTKAQLGAAPWQLVSAEHAALLQRMVEQFEPLHSVFPWNPLFGIKTGLNDAFVIDGGTRDNLIRQDRESEQVIRPFLAGKDVRRYFVRHEGRHVIYLHPDKDVDGFTAVEKHLRTFRKALDSRASSQKWYELQQPAVALGPILEKAKIVYPIIAPGPRFALEDSGYLVNDKVFVLPTDSKFLLGILNSSFGSFFFKTVCARLEGTGECYYEYRAQFVERFPLRRVDFSESYDKVVHNHMVELVDTALSLHKQHAAAESDAHKEVLGSQIDATDAEIDQLVHELYGLTEEEIRIVEKRK